ncbi:MAG TPA: S1/P1 nuclease [Gammaproteobacteria bacterium]|nr:S1/P1 nuclease [Gammaproteobacteria bacterium]
MPDSIGKSLHLKCLPVLALAVSALASSVSVAYGPQGHLIAGRVAEGLLCERAAATISDLADGDSLGEIGLWADEIRSLGTYDHAGPWHYMNIADGERLADFGHPPEGDVLWAIGHFSERLVDSTLSRQERFEALAFLVHFVVDIHQPLHVGLAEDRGGNAIELRYNGEETNLHRLWDTHVIEWTGLSVREYARSLGSAGADDVSLDPMVWAAESRALRSSVYAYGSERRRPPSSYLNAAADITRERLRLAALRLAGTLNTMLC